MIGDLETPGDLSAEKVGVGGGTVRCQGNLPSRSLGKEKKKEGGFSALSERNHRRSCTSRADNGLKKNTLLPPSLPGRRFQYDGT